MHTHATPSLSPFGRKWLRRVAILAAVVGAALGLETLLLHASTDPFADTRLYYDAGMRLNEGRPLYLNAVIDGIGPYANPPLLAILFPPARVAAVEYRGGDWEVVVIASFVADGLVDRGSAAARPGLVLGMLALPIAWCLVIGQAQVLLTLFVAIGAPWSVALAANILHFPAVIAPWWIGRRDWRNLGLFAGTMAGLALFRPAGPSRHEPSLDYLMAISLKRSAPS